MTIPALTVVIPALDAAESLPATLAALAEGRTTGVLGEVLVVDGGSRDGTAGLARAAGAELLAAPRGRGAQLRAGGEAARGDWLLFLHADSRPDAGWLPAVAAFMAEPANAERAAAFRLRFDDDAPAARRVAALANRRSRWLGLPYGDQGLLIGRVFYRRLGGYRPLPLMEDVELVRRIGRRRLTLLDCEIVTSAARYRRDGWWRRPLRNLSLLSAYLLGVPPRLLVRLYR